MTTPVWIGWHIACFLAGYAVSFWVWRRRSRAHGWSARDDSEPCDPSELLPPLYCQGWREGQEALREAWRRPRRASRSRGSTGRTEPGSARQTRSPRAPGERDPGLSCAAKVIPKIRIVVT